MVSEGDNIYIECKQVDDKGEIIKDDEEETFLDMTDLSMDFENNIAMQAIIGVSLMVMLYTLGNYVFKIYPTQEIKRRLYIEN